jgi:hypothetical protein
VTRRRRRSRSPLAGATLALVVGTSACGLGADASTPTESRASAAPTQAPTAQEVRVGDSVPATELAGWTAAALREAGTVRLTVTSGGRTLTGAVDVRGASPSYRLTGGTGRNAVDLRWVDKVAYLGGEQFRPVAGGRDFLRVRLGGTDMMSRLTAPLLTTLERAADPSALISRFGGLRATAVAVVDGRATWSMKATAAQLRAATEQLLGEPLPAQAASRLRAVTFEQTLDGDGRLVTARQVGGAEGDCTVAYSDYGAEVSISAPDAADVGTASG